MSLGDTLQTDEIGRRIAAWKGAEDATPGSRRQANGGGMRCESESSAAGGDAGQCVKDGPDAVAGQEIVQGQHQGAGVDADHVAAHPVPIQIDVAEPVSAAGRQRAIVFGLIQIVEDRSGVVRDGRGGGGQVGGAVNGAGRCVGAVRITGRRVARPVAGRQAQKRR